MCQESDKPVSMRPAVAVVLLVISAISWESDDTSRDS
jgi:hypothetical protein